MAQFGRVVAVIAANNRIRGISRRAHVVGKARRVAERDLRTEIEAAPHRRVITERVAETRVETAVELRQRSLRPQVGRRQDRRRVRRNVTENGMQIVVGHQELAHLERAPGPLQADERFATREAGRRAITSIP